MVLLIVMVVIALGIALAEHGTVKRSLTVSDLEKIARETGR